MKIMFLVPLPMNRERSPKRFCEEAWAEIAEYEESLFTDVRFVRKETSTRIVMEVRTLYGVTDRAFLVSHFRELMMTYAGVDPTPIPE